MKIQVKQDHIDRGKREHCQKCPIALAISEAFPGTQVSVFARIRNTIIDDGDFVYRAYVRIDAIGRILPDSVSQFIDDFDFLRPVQPFEFDLNYNKI